ncbi:unnamed protein product [Closterium sp. Naga37s-1]|nr:unnamed protein product [Closterium sp. Naga37s-1]
MRRDPRIDQPAAGAPRPQVVRDAFVTSAPLRLAASLLATGAASASGGAGSAPRPVGFGGYVGSARVQTTAAGGAAGGRESAEGAAGEREGQGGEAEAAAGSGPKELVIGAVSAGGGGRRAGRRGGLQRCVHSLHAPQPTDVGGEAAAHLRRLAKKDATTKLKALEALQGVLGGSSAAQMQAMLPAWAFEYRRLVHDGSRAVRLATHATMTLLVKGVGKGLAPHLKQLMGPWWVAQFDSSRDVAAAASLSFQTAFPTPTRRVEALAFSWEAVVPALAELLAATPQSLAAADRSLSVEEAKHRLDELLCAALLALRAFLQTLLPPPPHRGAAAGGAAAGGAAAAAAAGAPAALPPSVVAAQPRMAASLLSSLRALSFLRALAKHPSPRVRSAAYHALPAVLLSLGPQGQEGEGASSEGGENRGEGGAGGGGGERTRGGEVEVMGEAEVVEKVGPVVAAAMGEKVSACHGAMWELVLVASRTCPSLWANPSFLKSALPKLWGFLRAGCLGSAEQSYPCLLLLLSVFFRARLHQSQGVLVPFFSSLWQGRLVHMARPDWLALLTCVRECLVLSVVQLRREEGKVVGEEEVGRGEQKEGGREGKVISAAELVKVVLWDLCFLDLLPEPRNTGSDLGSDSHGAGKTEGTGGKAEGGRGGAAAGERKGGSAWLGAVVACVGETVRQVMQVERGKGWTGGGGEETQEVGRGEAQRGSVMDGFWSCVVDAVLSAVDAPTAAAVPSPADAAKESTGESEVALLRRALAGSAAADGGRGTGTGNSESSTVQAVLKLLQQLKPTAAAAAAITEPAGVASAAAGSVRDSGKHSKWVVPAVVSPLMHRLLPLALPLPLLSSPPSSSPARMEAAAAMAAALVDMFGAPAIPCQLAAHDPTGSAAALESGDSGVGHTTSLQLLDLLLAHTEVGAGEGVSGRVDGRAHRAVFVLHVKLLSYLALLSLPHSSSSINNSSSSASSTSGRESGAAEGDRCVSLIVQRLCTAALHLAEQREAGAAEAGGGHGGGTPSLNMPACLLAALLSSLSIPSSPLTATASTALDRLAMHVAASTPLLLLPSSQWLLQTLLSPPPAAPTRLSLPSSRSWISPSCLASVYASLHSHLLSSLLVLSTSPSLHTLSLMLQPLLLLVRREGSVRGEGVEVGALEKPDSEGGGEGDATSAQAELAACLDVLEPLWLASHVSASSAGSGELSRGDLLAVVAACSSYLVSWCLGEGETDKGEQAGSEEESEDEEEETKEKGEEEEEGEEGLELEEEEEGGGGGASGEGYMEKVLGGGGAAVAVGAAGAAWGAAGVETGVGAGGTGAGEGSETARLASTGADMAGPVVVTVLPALLAAANQWVSLLSHPPSTSHTTIHSTHASSATLTAPTPVVILTARLLTHSLATTAMSPLSHCRPHICARWAADLVRFFQLHGGKEAAERRVIGWLLADLELMGGGEQKWTRFVGRVTDSCVTAGSPGGGRAALAVEMMCAWQEEHSLRRHHHSTITPRGGLSLGGVESDSLGIGPAVVVELMVRAARQVGVEGEVREGGEMNEGEAAEGAGVGGGVVGRAEGRLVSEVVSVLVQVASQGIDPARASPATATATATPTHASFALKALCGLLRRFLAAGAWGPRQAWQVVRQQLAAVKVEREGGGGGISSHGDGGMGGGRGRAWVVAEVVGILMPVVRWGDQAGGRGETAEGGAAADGEGGRKGALEQQVEEEVVWWVQRANEALPLVACVEQQSAEARDSLALHALALALFPMPPSSSSSSSPNVAQSPATATTPTSSPAQCAALLALLRLQTSRHATAAIAAAAAAARLAAAAPAGDAGSVEPGETSSAVSGGTMRHGGGVSADVGEGDELDDLDELDELDEAGGGDDVAVDELDELDEEEEEQGGGGDGRTAQRGVTVASVGKEALHQQKQQQQQQQAGGEAAQEGGQESREEWTARVDRCLLTLASSAVAYSWQEMAEADMAFVGGRLRRALAAAAMAFEELVEGMGEGVGEEGSGQKRVAGKGQSKEGQAGDDEQGRTSGMAGRLEAMPLHVAGAALSLLSMLLTLHSHASAGPAATTTSSIFSLWASAAAWASPSALWASEASAAVVRQGSEHALRIFIATGLAETALPHSSAASNAATSAASSAQSSQPMTAWRLQHPLFFRQLSRAVLAAPPRAVEAAVRAAEIWGAGRGPIAGLYALMCGPSPGGSVRLAAFWYLSREQVLPAAVGSGVVKGGGEGETHGEPVGDGVRPELAHILKPANRKELLTSSLTSPQRVRYYLAACLVLHRIQSLPASPPSPPLSTATASAASPSSPRDRLVSFIQATPTLTLLLDLVAQNLLLAPSPSHSSAAARRLIHLNPSGPLPPAVAQAGDSAIRAVAQASPLDVALEVLTLPGAGKLSVPRMRSLAAAVFGAALRVVPGGVRRWYADVREKGVRRGMDIFTARYCSAHMIALELAQVCISPLASPITPNCSFLPFLSLCTHNSLLCCCCCCLLPFSHQAQKVGGSKEDLTVRTRRSAREVWAAYCKDEAKLELVIKLPDSYPLRGAAVESSKGAGVKEAEMRKWLLAANSFLLLGGGSVADAVVQWCECAEKKFEGVEDCPICYSVIHSSNGSLPRLQCRTCKHKFHPECLYQWFQSSHKSTCPLCQTSF